MLLTEIIKDLNVRKAIRLDNSLDLADTYDVDGEKLTGIQCVSKFVAESLAKGYKLSAKRMSLGDEPIDFSTGPEQMLKILYSTRIINEIASKYKLITTDESLANLETWENYLKPGIFNEIIGNPMALNKMQEIDLNEHLPKLQKTNKNQTVTRYKYKFYEAEKPEWANNDRLKYVDFSNGYIEIEIELPVQEVPDATEGA